MFDKTKSGRIDVYGFSALWKFIQQWKNLFQQYDRDCSGSISYTELQQGESLAGTRCAGTADLSLYSLGQSRGALCLLTTSCPTALQNAALSTGALPTPSVTWLDSEPNPGQGHEQGWILTMKFLGQTDPAGREPWGWKLSSPGHCKAGMCGLCGSFLLSF